MVSRQLDLIERHTSCDLGTNDHFRSIGACVTCSQFGF